MKTLIAVPTYKRSHMYPNSGTWRFLPFIKLINLDIKVFIKNTPNEIEAYAKLKRYSKEYHYYDYISELRYFIINYAIIKNYTHLIFIDDDLRFNYKAENMYNLLPMTKKKDLINDMLRQMIFHCHEITPLTHPNLRFGGNKNKEKFLYNKKAIRCVCLHLPTIKKENINTDIVLKNIKFMSDYYIQLSLLQKGYKTLCINQYTVDDLGTNTRGGCSNTRNRFLHSQSAFVISKLFQHVKLRKKSNGNWLEPRYDVTVQWSKYLKEVKNVNK